MSVGELATIQRLDFLQLVLLILIGLHIVELAVIGKATGATPGQGSVFGLSGPSSQAALSGGTGSSSSAAANPGFGLGTRLGAPGGSHLQ